MCELSVQLDLAGDGREVQTSLAALATSLNAGIDMVNWGWGRLQ